MPEVYESALLEAGAARVWQVVRDFNGLPNWHPGVVDSRIEAALPADRIGCVRNFRLADGGVIRERLLGLSDHDYLCQYSILESPMPLTDYIATMRLIPVTDGNQTFAEWSACFNCAQTDREELIRHVGQDVFAAGLRSLQKRFVQK